MRDVLVALNTKDGSEKWRIDFPKQFGSELPTFGFVCSPLVHGDKLYVQAGGGLAAIDSQTGKLLWKSLEDGGGMNGSAFSSPTLATLHGRQQLLVQTRTKIAGVDPETGSKISGERDSSVPRNEHTHSDCLERLRVHKQLWWQESVA